MLGLLSWSLRLADIDYIKKQRFFFHEASFVIPKLSVLGLSVTNSDLKKEKIGRLNGRLFRLHHTQVLLSKVRAFRCQKALWYQYYLKLGFIENLFDDASNLWISGFIKKEGNTSLSSIHFWGLVSIDEECFIAM